MRTVTVVAGVFWRDDEVLAFRRSAERDAGGQWEFPGGKVEAGETPAAALVRELLEELGCEVRVGDLVDRSTTVVGEVAIDLVVHRVSPVGDWPTHSVDHDSLRWVRVSDLLELEWAAPDLAAVSVLRGM